MPSGQIIPNIRLNRSSPVPLYFQVAEQLESAIVDGHLRPGDRISNEVTLAAELGLSRPTMRQAIQLLVDKGMLVRRRGVGTQVVHGKIRRSVELTSLYDDLAAAGRQPRTDVLALELVKADKTVAEELELELGQPVWFIERLRCVGDEPLALMRNYCPIDAVDLANADLRESGLYEVLRMAGHHLRVARQRISAQRANTRQAGLLHERRGAPLLTMQRTAYDDHGAAVELGQHVYRPDLYAFELTLVDR